MSECETCKQLKERAEFIQRYDFRDGREAWGALLDHQLSDHGHQVKPNEAKAEEVKR
jgi:hypothetical protein